MITILDCTGLICKLLTSELDLTPRSYNAISTVLNKVDVGKILVSKESIYNALGFTTTVNSDITIYSGVPFTSNSYTTSLITTAFLSVINPDIVIGSHLYANRGSVDIMNEIFTNGITHIKYTRDSKGFTMFLNNKITHCELFENGISNDKQILDAILCIVRQSINTIAVPNTISDTQQYETVELRSQLELCKRDLEIKNNEIKQLKLQLKNNEELLVSIKALMNKA